MRWLIPLALLSTPLASTPLLAAAGSIPDVAGIAYEQKIGAALPMDALLSDDDGKIVELRRIAEGRPLVLSFGYYHCTALCNILRENLLRSLDAARLKVGRDYSFATIGIDPLESAADARAVKMRELEGRRSVDVGEFHFLTGDAAVLTKLAAAVGFETRRIRERNFAHPVGVVFVSPSGVISSYLLGVSFSPEDIRVAVRRAANGKSAPPASPLLLLCYDFDPASGRYSFAIIKALRLASAATAGVALFLLARGVLGEKSRS